MDDHPDFLPQQLQAHPKSLPASPAERYACKYCADGLFTDESMLWDHFQAAHPDQLKNPALVRKSFRDEARQVAAERALSTANAKPSHLPNSPAPPSRKLNRISLNSQSNNPPIRQRGTQVDAADRNIRPKYAAHATGRQQGQQQPHKAPTGAERWSGLSQSHHHQHHHQHHQHQQQQQQQQQPAPPPSQRLPNVTSPIPGKLPSQPPSHHPHPYPHPHHPPPPPLQTQTHHDPSSYLPDSQEIIEGPLNTPRPRLILQPDSRPISQEQLAAEVKSIYAGLVMVENKCITVDHAQATALQSDSSQPVKLADDHWQALIALHRTLLHEHHDFFLASQHPSASPALRRLAGKYSMPARMWKHGIHSFLELLRRRLPESLDYMLAFIYLAYQMMALLYETVPSFEDTWIECLGDLGRYRMAIEDEDLRDRETWAGVARFWYSKAAHRAPSIGRLYHHLAILARPNALQQLYYYGRSLTCIQPFPNARDSILALLNPILGRTNAAYSHAAPVDTSFIHAHGILYVRDDTKKFDEVLDQFYRQLDAHVGHITAKWKEQGVYIAVTNIASLFDYGNPESVLRHVYDSALQQKNRPDSPTAEASQTNPTGSKPSGTSSPDNKTLDKDNSTTSQVLDLQSQRTFASAAKITFSTFQLVLRRIGDKNVLPHIHLLLAFLFTLTATQYDCSAIYENVPWDDLAYFLTKLAKSEKLELAAGQTPFQRQGETDTKPLPEDYLIEGQVWSALYFPKDWFRVAHDDEERCLELASTVKARCERILCLGAHLVSHTSWMTYDEGKKRWSATRSCRDPTGQNTSSPQSDSSNTSSEDVDMTTVFVPQSPTRAEPEDSEPMEDVVQQNRSWMASPPFCGSIIRIPQKSVKASLSNFTIFICDKSMLLQQSDLLPLLFKSGKVVVPETVILELGTMSDVYDAPGSATLDVLKGLHRAVEEGKPLFIADSKGNILSDPKDVFLQLTQPGMRPIDLEDDIAIGITRLQSNLNAQASVATDQSNKQPAVLVSENRDTRHKARRTGVASVAASKIRRFLTNP